MKLYSSFLSRAALARWTMTINPLSGTHLFLLLLRVLTSRSLPQSQPVSAPETKTEMEGRRMLRSCDCLARCSHSLISNHSAISNMRLSVQMNATPLARLERRTLQQKIKTNVGYFRLMVPQPTSSRVVISIPAATVLSGVKSAQC